MDSEIKLFKVTIEGDSLLMHNGQLADPLNQWSKALKAVSSKRKKTDEDHEEMGRLEFMGGLYYDEAVGPYIPIDLIDATLREGAKKKKLGTAFASAIQTAPDQRACPECSWPSPQCDVVRRNTPDSV